MMKYTQRLVILCVALIAAIAISGAKAAPIDDNATAVSKMLSQAKLQAFQLKEDAAQLQLFTMVPPSASSADQISTQSHAEAINVINGDVSAMSTQLAKLEGARKGAAPWQQTAIDGIKPLVTELISNTQFLIQFITKNPNRLNSAEYKDYVEANADKAIQLSNLIGSYVDYGKAKERLEHAGNKLGLPY